MNFFKSTLFSLLLAAGTASAATIDFEHDDAFGMPGGVSDIVPIKTQGFTFGADTVVIDVTNGGYSGSGPAHSGSFAALADLSTVLTMTASNGGLFAMQDFWIRGFDIYAGTASLTGYLDGVEVGALVLSITGDWQNVVANFAQVDRIVIDAGGNYLVDDIGATIAANDVPEPASIALFGLGLAGLGCAMRRKHARR